MINNKLYHRPKMNRNAHVGKYMGLTFPSTHFAY